jgi:hypothetical protein
MRSGRLIRWLCGVQLVLAGTTFAQQEVDSAAANTPEERGADAATGADLANSDSPFLAAVQLNHADPRYVGGDLLRVRLRSERPAYLYLIYHQADGSIVLLFPNPARPKNQVGAGQDLEFPGGVGTPYRFRVQAPFGPEVMQVIAVERPVLSLDELGQGPQPAMVTNELLAKVENDLRPTPELWAEHRVALETFAKQSKPPSAPAARVGLIVGIGKYQHLDKENEELRHSAKVMHDLMLRRGQLDPARTKLVLDDQATKANLQHLFTEWLPSVSKPGDTVFVYFCGHASTVPNSDGSEKDGQDETLCPFDLEGARTGERMEQGAARWRETNILDDTLARWFQSLQGRQLVFIADTCHAGGLAADKSLGSRLFADEASRLKDIAQLNTIVIASCASDEQSLIEGTRNKTAWFTFCLAEAIERQPPESALSVQDAFTYARSRIQRLLREGRAAREQEPQMADNALLPVVLAPAQLSPTQTND